MTDFYKNSFNESTYDIYSANPLSDLQGEINYVPQTSYMINDLSNSIGKQYIIVDWEKLTIWRSKFDWKKVVFYSNWDESYLSDFKNPRIYNSNVTHPINNPDLGEYIGGWNDWVIQDDWVTEVFPQGDYEVVQNNWNTYPYSNYEIVENTNSNLNKKFKNLSSRYSDNEISQELSSYWKFYGIKYPQSNNVEKQKNYISAYNLFNDYAGILWIKAAKLFYIVQKHEMWTKPNDMTSFGPTTEQYIKIKIVPLLKNNSMLRNKYPNLFKKSSDIFEWNKNILNRLKNISEIKNEIVTDLDDFDSWTREISISHFLDNPEKKAKLRSEVIAYMENLILSGKLFFTLHPPSNDYSNYVNRTDYMYGTVWEKWYPNINSAIAKWLENDPNISKLNNKPKFNNIYILKASDWNYAMYYYFNDKLQLATYVSPGASNMKTDLWQYSLHDLDVKHVSAAASWLYINHNWISGWPMPYTMIFNGPEWQAIHFGDRVTWSRESHWCVRNPMYYIKIMSMFRNVFPKWEKSISVEVIDN